MLQVVKIIKYSSIPIRRQPLYKEQHYSYLGFEG